MRIITQYNADLLNGEGLRNVYFYSSCPHHCPGCFSPETWEEVSDISKLWTEDDFLELIRDASKSYISGITLTGGDPLSLPNCKEILDLCKRFKEHFGDSKTIWIYTGYTWETIEKAKDERWECLKYIDVLCDGPYIDSLRSPEKPWVGSENQRVINVQESLKKGKIILL
jgi:anaerobic ribonucleoside-triphosphate reductase activating protein